MNLTLDKVTTEMLKELLKREKKYDAKKYVQEFIRKLYLQGY